MLKKIAGKDIIERTNNYIKFGDGTMIQRKKRSQATYSVSGWGSLYYTDIDMGNWTEEFIDDDIECFPYIRSSQFWSIAFGQTKTSAGKVRLVRPDSYSQSAQVSVVAIGRWK